MILIAHLVLLLLMYAKFANQTIIYLLQQTHVSENAQLTTAKLAYQIIQSAKNVNMDIPFHLKNAS